MITKQRTAIDYGNGSPSQRYEEVASDWYLQPKAKSLETSYPFRGHARFSYFEKPSFLFCNHFSKSSLRSLILLEVIARLFYNIYKT